MADIIITTTINDLVSAEATIAVSDFYGYQVVIPNPINPSEMIQNPETRLDFVVRKLKEAVTADILAGVTSYRTKNSISIAQIVATDYAGKTT